MTNEQGKAPMPLLELERIGKRYGGVVALEGVSVKIRPGTVTGLVGNNGAGKSTLVRILSGVNGQDEGTIRWKGSEVRFRSPADARRTGIDTVFQELALADDLDAAGNVFLNRELSYGFGPFRFRRDREMRRRAAELFERFGINLPSNGSIRSMSGGQRQGVAIGRALLGGSELLLLDEPTAALGVKESRHIEELMLSLRSQGIAIVLVSHSVDQLLHVCDQLLVLRRGQMVGVYERADLTPRDVVSLIVGADELETDMSRLDVATDAPGVGA
ncbi:MAG TPA: ATP-binding cassette domain-containing protein [Devosia sp.]|jgi:ABC-type sugar transport system ATPase subunit|nr:ATP-binding cassette domain-containing protein [Devosia sp.]